MAWVVKAWKPEVLAAAEREGVRLPEPGAQRERPDRERGERFARRERATLHDSPLGELFRSTA